MKLTVFPNEPAALKDVFYAVGIVSSGYESRGRFAWNYLGLRAKQRICFLFPDHKVLDYEANRKFFEEAGFSAVDPTLAATHKALNSTAVANELTPDGSAMRVVVDISCMTRLLIASTCYEIAQLATRLGHRILVDFVYSCAEFGEVPKIDGPVTVNGPAIPALAGWPQNPASSLGVIIGIGYEEDLALGVIEELEATSVWAFRPKDHDPRYETEIEAKNHGLFDEIPPANMVRYSLFDPFSLFCSVEALVGLAKQKSRLVVVPLGPKLFALVGCLATLRHHPAVGFWRVSNGENVNPVERRASGKILVLQTLFEP